MTTTPSFHEDMETHYDEPFHWLFFGFKLVVFLGFASVLLLLLVFTTFQNSMAVTLLTALFGILLLLAGTYDLWCQYWKWVHWGIKVNIDSAAAELYRPGNGRSLFPYVADRGVQYMPLRGAQVTRNDQSVLEQWFFRRSSTLSLDGNAQGDFDWQNIRYVRNARRIKNIILAFNEREYRLEQAASDHLANIETSNQQILKVLGELTELLKPLLIALNSRSDKSPEVVDDGPTPSHESEDSPVVDDTGSILPLDDGGDDENQA